jgi:hypothetical protein
MLQKKARYIKKKRENMHTHTCGNTRRQKCLAKGRGREAKIQDCIYIDTTNVEHEITTTPVKTGATGILTKGLRKNLEAIP